LIELYDSLENNSFNCIAAIEGVAEHSLVNTFAEGRPDEKDINELQDFGLKIDNLIKKDNYNLNIKIPGNRPYKIYNGVSVKPITSDECNDCGLCAKECPSGAIDISNCKETDNFKCVSCMHCVAICPQNARRLDEIMVNKTYEKLKDRCLIRKENKLYF